MLWLRPNLDALAALGVHRAVDWPANTEWPVPLAPQDPIRVELADGAPTGLLSGSVGLTSFTLLRADGTRTPPLQLVPGDGPLDWKATDGDGAEWFTISHGMRSPDVASHGLTLFTADVRSGKALAEWSGHGEAGLLIGNARLQLPMAAARPKVDLAKSCAMPNWPGTPGFITDVHLRSIDTVDVLRCRALPGGGACDGPGGNDGEFVLVPSATLRNSTAANASEVPWYTKFSGNFPPYGNDQHPYLVWNLYRVDADGVLEQIARSGLKHAFATANEQCSEACFNPHILGRGCQDLYDAGSNDFAFALAPRSEIIPARGVWGRCLSVYDDTLAASGNLEPGCDAVQDPAPPDDQYQQRLRVRESDVEPASNPGATFFLDAWYLVRGDRDIYNTMGSRPVAPAWGTRWTPGPVGAFEPGPVLDRWLAMEGAGETWRADVASDEGTIGLAVRVRQLPDQRWRYDYAVMNFDFTRAVTQGAEPNLHIVRNLGLSGMSVALANGAVVEASSWRDGDDVAGNDWTAVQTPASLDWTMPGGAHLEWGRLVSFSLVSPHAPGAGALRFAVAEPGVPASYSLAAPVPDGAAIFRDDFE